MAYTTANRRRPPLIQVIYYEGHILNVNYASMIGVAAVLAWRALAAIIKAVLQKGHVLKIYFVVIVGIAAKPAAIITIVVPLAN